MKQDIELDNHIYMLQQDKKLPKHLKEKLTQADIAYLQDRDDLAWRLVKEIEGELHIKKVIPEHKWHEYGVGRF